jgi:hypothetical protein
VTGGGLLDGEVLPGDASDGYGDDGDALAEEQIAQVGAGGGAVGEQRRGVAAEPMDRPCHVDAAAARGHVR